MGRLLLVFKLCFLALAVARLRSHADTKVYTLNKNNRDDVCLEVHDQLKSILG